MKIYTAHKKKQFKYRYDVPDKVLKSDFDYLDEDKATDGFIQYRKNWYHTSDFMRIDWNAPKEFQKWHGYSSDSFFSGVLIWISDDGETYKIGTYIS